ncbi:MAG TPA: type IV toxin-antitoxin system AbiEi family antitoxin domain-containing protein [Longimicrobiales bacterium]
MVDTRTERLLEFVKERGLVRAREAEAAGYPTALLYRLRDRGDLEQVGRGLFRHPEAEITEWHSYAEAVKLVPAGVVCLLSALVFHGIGTQNPWQIWMALEKGKQRPRSPVLPLKIVWFSGDAMREGVETHRIEGVDVRVFGPAKTVADLFKFRNKVGVDVAVEALREGWERRLFTADELMRFAKICRVQRVMKPYLQAIA